MNIFPSKKNCAAPLSVKHLTGKYLFTHTAFETLDSMDVRLLLSRLFITKIFKEATWYAYWA